MDDRTARDPAAAPKTRRLGVETRRRRTPALEFFAIGHELRTPITSIRAHLDTIIDTAPGSGAQRRFLRRARSETLRLARFVNGMFEFSMLDLSAAAADPPCFLDEAIAEARDAEGPYAPARSMRVDVAPTTPGCVALDSDQCVRIFANLLENALKYGRECGTVRITYERANRASIDVCVDDDGPGIHPREREETFALRFRGSAAPRAAGSGLGLAIVRRTLEHVGGSIALLDSPLGGARFVASIPPRAEKTEDLS